MMWRRLSFVFVPLAACLFARPVAAQLAPTGGHYAAQPSDTGFAGGVSSSGGYSSSVPLDLPAARGGLPIPLQLVYTERGIGAAGLGWEVPLSYIVRDTTIAHRRPMSIAGGGWQAREEITLVLGGNSLNLVRTATGYAARSDAPAVVARQQGDGTWVVFDGAGHTYSFTVAAATGSVSMWLLKTVTGVGGSSLVLEYSIAAPTVPGGGGLAIDLTTVSYNPHPTTVGCFKNAVSLAYDDDATAPLSLSVLGDRILVRSHKLTAINVKAKATCSDAYVRLHGYNLEYTQDPDTQLPHLLSVKLVGRDRTVVESCPCSCTSTTTTG